MTFRSFRFFSFDKSKKTAIFNILCTEQVAYWYYFILNTML